MSTPEGGQAWAAIIADHMPRKTTQRVRVHRRLRQAGALAVRPGVYALPDSPEAREALADAAREMTPQRGAALACLVSWLDAAAEQRLRARFDVERNRHRERLLKHIGALERAVASGSRLKAANRQTAGARLARMRKRLDRIAAPAPSIPMPEARQRPPRPSAVSGRAAWRGRTWVTRKGVLIDRMASAWLIQRFVDPQAHFRFMNPGDPPPAGALRFDMAEAEFGHEGDRCTFETLVDRFRRDDPALRLLSEIVHDLDIKDAKYGRDEAPGVARVIAGLTTAEPDDAQRIRQGQWLFDCLYASQRPRTPQLPKGALP